MKRAAIKRNIKTKKNPLRTISIEVMRLIRLKK